jgi:hypothetical protein
MTTSAVPVAYKSVGQDDVPSVNAIVVDAVAVDSTGLNDRDGRVSNVHWDDDYFSGYTGEFGTIVSVFDLDYSTMKSYYTFLTWSAYAVTSVACPSLFGYSLLFCVPCFLNRNVEWNVNAQHIAVTKKGILFVYDERKCGYGWGCTSVGRQNHFVSVRDTGMDVQVVVMPMTLTFSLTCIRLNYISS